MARCQSARSPSAGAPLSRHTHHGLSPSDAHLSSKNSQDARLAARHIISSCFTAPSWRHGVIASRLDRLAPTGVNSIARHFAACCCPTTESTVLSPRHRIDRCHSLSTRVTHLCFLSVRLSFDGFVLALTDASSSSYLRTLFLPCIAQFFFLKR